MELYSRFIMALRSITQNLKSRHGFIFAAIGILAALVLFPFLAGFYPTVRFPREYIDVHVFPGHITVKARYVYKNPFPFPVV